MPEPNKARIDQHSDVSLQLLPNDFDIGRGEDSSPLSAISGPRVPRNSSDNRSRTMSLHSVRNKDEPLDPEAKGNDQDRKPRRAVSYWKFELFFMALSVGGLLAIVAILFAYDKKSIKIWHAIIRTNAVVSALSTLTKSAMLMVIGQGIGRLKWVYFEQQPHRLTDFEIFDGASRGPFGSIELFFKINWRAFMASLGALMTILALAMDPFVQQIISIDDVTLNNTALVGTLEFARNYNTQTPG